MAEVLTEVGQLLQLQGRKSAITTLALNMCPSSFLSPLGWKCSGALVGKEASELADQLATIVVGVRDEGAMAKKGTHLQETPFTDIVLVASRVAISRCEFSCTSSQYGAVER